ncbi:hypothetical protein Tco_0329321, partial [Tanacetum coccineum]
IQGRYGYDMDFDFDFDTAKLVFTAGAAVTTTSVAAVSTASPTRRVSTADDITMDETLVYIRKSAAKDKAVVRLQDELEEEERQRISKRFLAEEREMYIEAEQARMLVELINQRKGILLHKELKKGGTSHPHRLNRGPICLINQAHGSEVDRAVPKLAAGSLKRDAEEELDQESSKRQKTGTRRYWKIIRVGNHTKVHHFFDDILKAFDRDDLVMLWSLVKEKFNSTEPTDDKEKEIWVELKRLFEPDTDDELWKLQNHIHDLTWRLYDSCGVHHVFTEKGIDIYMLVGKEYPLSRGTLTLMLVAKLLVDQDNNMSRELLKKIFMQRLPSAVINTWDLFEKEFIWQYCSPFKTANKLEEIRNFKQEIDETLYHAWERYSDLLYRCQQHDLNSQQIVHIFYTRLDISSHKMLDSRGFIPLMTLTQTLKLIQVMADHSHNWYDETTTKEKINDNPNNIDAIQESFKEVHPTKECPLKKEDKAVEQSKYMRSLAETIIKLCKESIKKQAAEDEWIRKFIENTKSNIRALKTTTKILEGKAYMLTQTVLTNTGEKFKARTTMGKENMKEPVLRDLPPMTFLEHLKEQMGSPCQNCETFCMIGNPKKVHKMKAQEDEGDKDASWGITTNDVERLVKHLTHTIHTLPNLKSVVQPYMPLGPVHDKEKIIREEEHDYDIPQRDGVVQPLTPQTIHITPPDDDYVAPATNIILDKQLNEFEEEFSDINRVAEKANDKELSDVKTYDCKTFI